MKPEETKNQNLFELGNGRWNIPELRELLEKSLSQRGAIEHLKLEHDFPEVGYKVMAITARQIGRDKVGGQKTLLVIEDIAEPKQAGGHTP